MSTFDGIVAEFPDIRIDYFRTDPSRPPPLRFFLSHVHSDHLQGLDSCRSPFIHCSPATREIMLRLAKYPHRMNFAKGILESRRQTYKHLAKILKPIPLETPTEIELAPGKTIRVTLFDANHCVGAVMFLIEGGGNAILYTGDIRSESWWVNSLCRNPVLLPYVCDGTKKPLKQLDNIYLDTTFATKENKYRHFPTKAEGVSELLKKAAQYPPETRFYFDTWTFGYEEVWQALSTFLGSRIHVDDYRYGVYSSLGNSKDAPPAEFHKLIRSQCGNHVQEGCLSNRDQRIHSCEKGSGCDIWERDFVRITPIISRHSGLELAEAGAGGGQGDLHQQYNLELGDNSVIAQLMAVAVQKLSGTLLAGFVDMVKQATATTRNAISLELAEIVAEANNYGASEVNADLADLDQFPIERVVMLLAKRVTKNTQAIPAESGTLAPRFADQYLPRQITFPYPRHSSYEELCSLVEAFKPRNIHPCTVDERNWDKKASMSYLFGHFYDTSVLFAHDQMMFRQMNEDEGGDGETLMSPLDDYESPPMETQRSQDEEITPHCSSRGSFTRQIGTTRSISPGKRKSEDDEIEESKRRRASTHGDFWPPRAIATRGSDHCFSQAEAPEDAKSFRSRVFAGRTVVEGRRVFVSNIFPGTTIHDVERLFKNYPIEGAHIPANNRDCAFVNFDSAPAAHRAAAELQGSLLVGRNVNLEIAHSNNSSSLSQQNIERSTEPERAWSQPAKLAEKNSSPTKKRNLWQQRIAAARETTPSENKTSASADRPSAGHSRTPVSASSADLRRVSASFRVPDAARALCSKEWPVGSWSGTSKLKRRTTGYGRLSPPPVVESPRDTDDEFVELTADELKEALQRDAYDAVLNGGANWSLVSVDGHQVKEEEL